MESTITLGQLFLASIGIIGAGLAFWKTTDVKQATMKQELSSLKDTVSDLKKDRDSDRIAFTNKFDKVMDGINEIKVILQTKADKEHSQHHHR